MNSRRPVNSTVGCLLYFMAIDPIDYEKFKRLGVPYGLYFGLLQIPVAWVAARWVSMPVAYGLSLGILTLVADPIFMRGMPIYFLRWRTGTYWTFFKWLPWSVLMGLVGFAIGYVLPPLR
jgi:hypothetical protein